VTDNRMKDRVKVMLAGTTPDSETSEHALIAPNPGLPNQALHVLTMAQRTAEEHVASAHHQADKIRTDALAAAEEIAREAQAHAHTVRREADKVLFDARASAEQTARDARNRVDEAQQKADKIVSDARAKAEAIAAEAQANADQLKLQAHQRYEDVVGSLGTKREALQQQIEALEQFDREYRSRLTSFMQGQLRALWVDQPQVTGDVDAPPAQPVSPAQPDSTAEAPPAPTGAVSPVSPASPVSQASEKGAQAKHNGAVTAVPLQRNGGPADARPIGAHASAAQPVGAHASEEA
jgi:cell division septum initiation protein DivIVA